MSAGQPLESIHFALLRDVAEVENALSKLLREAGAHVHSVDDAEAFAALVRRRTPHAHLDAASPQDMQLVYDLRHMCRAAPSFPVLAIIHFRPDGAALSREDPAPKPSTSVATTVSIIVLGCGSQTDSPDARRDSGPAGSSSRLGRLTARQREVLFRVGLGEDNLKIAVELGVSESAIRGHVSHLYALLACETRIELARISWGLLS